MMVQASSRAKRRALIVDDVSFNRRLMSSALLVDGLAADEASDADTAIAALAQGHYEIVLLDLSLGSGGSGFDVLQAIRSRPDLDALPVVLVSGAASDPDSIAKGLLAGANDFVTKPFDTTVLRARVAAARRSREALLHVRARADHLTIEAERARDELTCARLVQRAALPRVPLRQRGFRVTGEVVPSGDISGDFFDVVTDAVGRLSVILVDVAGHGAPAAIVASAARMTLSNALSAGDPLDKVMESLGRCLRSQGDVPEATAALAIARFDPGGERVEVVNAGLPPLLCAQPDGPLLCFSSTSAPAGLFEGARHVTEVAAIELGSLMIMTSDGLWGRHPTDDYQPLIRKFDVAGRGTAIASAGGAHMSGLILEIMAAFGASAGEDDATLVVVANDDSPATLREGWPL